MDQNIQLIIDLVTGNSNLSAEGKVAIIDKLKETSEELEQKRKSVEAQNRELEIEASLERVRAVAMSMNKADDMPDVCKMISQQMELLNVKEVRNVQTAIFNKEKGTYMNYEYYSKHDKKIITETSYTNNKIHAAFAEKMFKGNGEFFETDIVGDDVKDWIAYQKTTNVFIDDFLYTAASLNYYWFSLGPVALGISTYTPLKEEDKVLFKRFAKVFELAYRRYLDIEKAEAQAREAQIQLALERVRARTMAMQKSDELLDVIQIVSQQLIQLNFKIGAATFALNYKKNNDFDFWIAVPGRSQLTRAYIPYFDHPLFKNFIAAKEKGFDFFTQHLDFDEKNSYFHHFFKNIPDRQEEEKKLVYQSKGYAESQVLLKSVALGIANLDAIPYSDEENAILKRVANVFEQTYTRFLDLQRAEAQARESQIQLALERVRAKTMAMQKSEDLREVSFELYYQLKELGEPADQLTIGVIKEEENVVEVSATLQGKILSQQFRHSIDEPIVMQKIFRAWKAGQQSLIIDISGEELEKYNRYRNELTNSTMFPINITDERRILYVAFYSKGTLALATAQLRPLESLHLLERFAKVFDGTFTRFLDLQKAEAQTRESQIELSLERVRAKTMAMHNSTDVGETAAVMVDELKKLGIETMRCGIGIMHEPGDMEVWTISTDENNKTTIIIGWLDMNMHPLLHGSFESWRNKNESYSYELKDEDLLNYYNAINNYPGYPIRYDTASLPNPIHHNEFYFTEGTLFAFSLQQLTDEQRKIFKRFAAVFGQTYRRYLDLQKAEAQAREAQIEAALERVRARAMSMQKSDELKELIGTVFTELTKLDLVLTRCLIMIYDIKTNDSIWWMANSEAPSDPIGLFVKYHEEHPYLAYLKAWQERQIKWQYILEGNIKKEWDDFLFVETELSMLPDFVIEGMKAPDRVYLNASFNTFGNLTLASLERLSDEHFDILLRFAKVFDLTYTRFNDLKQAEAQAREAQIETSLERVRAAANAMHKSTDLLNVISILSEQFLYLGFKIDSANFNTSYRKKDWNLWLYNPGLPMYPDQINIPYFDHPYFNCTIDALAKGSEFNAFVFDKKTKDSFLDYIYATTVAKNITDERKKLNYSKPGFAWSVVYLKNTAVTIANYDAEPYTEEQNTILRRFGNVFEQSYTRFLDLQKAEAQAKEAQIEAALERVRSRTLSMQKSDELTETAAVLFKQLISLGIEPNRLYIGIIHDDNGEIEAWATDEEGGRISSMFILNRKKNASVKKIYNGWKKGDKTLIIDMQGDELHHYLHYLTEELKVPFTIGLTQKRRVQYIAYFSKGFIGMASPEEQSQETIELLERFAWVFNLTFTRFNDLKIAEAHAIQAEEDLIKLQTEKKRAEDALNELQITQKQLIQAEKMASLGELTAGIAHEIQNPLNFVNNFSEVSKELLDEMKAALENGDDKDAKEIAQDIILNLEKIHHHGKRADAIVKGMLQHSRSSTGAQKEPTDINALCDEYLRLSYHGLRAKDKNFNANLKTDFDESVGKINIIPQDIGRVLLNILTNAFYATNEKLREQVSQQKTYSPLVSIQTKKLNDKVEIVVSDNGNGIPPGIIDKIFQPFFTTKPTGQGTGLGLSLTYDIIKAHNGEIKAETTENKGTSFIIRLPVS